MNNAAKNLTAAIITAAGISADAVAAVITCANLDILKAARHGFTAAAVNVGAVELEIINAGATVARDNARARLDGNPRNLYTFTAYGTVELAPRFRTIERCARWIAYDARQATKVAQR